MYRPAQLAGYFALVLTAGALLVNSATAPVSLSTGTVGVQIGLVLTAAVAGVVEHRRELSQFETPGFDRSDGIDALAVVAGAVVTYALSVSAGLGPVLASALVGLLVGLTIPEVGAPAYCGSFVGMASPAVFASLEFVALAGVVAGLGFVASTESFGGVGGKLGTLALFGCVTTAAIVGLDYTSAGPPQWELVSTIVPVAVLGAVATVVLSVRLELGAVIGSGVVGVAAGVAFPLAAPELGTTLAAAAFCASFVGMSSVERLGGIAHIALVGGLSGFVFLAVTPAFDGAGGKLGTVAFVSCIGLIGALELREFAVERMQ
ncbi:hypothetical protein GS429_20910 [Natronorubrum sp. JWXQ-INN-674]|uniref:Uncharacterized protein n=1 Tax=Natronorubrum halalkaliphilum TaxID=2691917 RepID=A0A6B0VSU7_9EURY|nr:hypothetical protein [Natronorubrum halalkaliphilum]MXV64485.1 hypothetical protein [Natronorubrum halalkaliphilum]